MANTTTTAPTPAAARPTRNNALAAGLFYLVTFAASIPAAFLIAPVLNDAGYIVGGSQDTRVLVGCLLDVVNALACIGTAVAVFPVVRHHDEALAVGFVTSRMFEAAVIMIGVVCLLAIVTLRQDLAGVTGAEAVTLTTTGHALLAVRDWTFLLGPGLMPGINALLFGTLLYRSRLVPRIIPAVGLIGAPLLVAGDVAAYFGLVDRVSAWTAVGALPVAVWELAVGIWMVVKGFRCSAITVTAR